jgi:hypothetical protein
MFKSVLQPVSLLIIVVSRQAHILSCQAVLAELVQFMACIFSEVVIDLYFWMAVIHKTISRRNVCGNSC